MIDNDYILLGYKGNSNSSFICKEGKVYRNSGVVYSSYIPIQIIETDEERKARIKRERAGKKFAKVRLSHPDTHKRGKRGEIVDSKVENGKQMHCLNIEIINTCTKNGSCSWIGFIKSKDTYKDIWFYEDELECFEEYDSNGDKL